MNDVINELQLKIERLENEISFKNGLISILSHDSKEMFGNFLWLIEALEDKMINKEDFSNLLPQVKGDARKNMQTIQDSTAWLKTQYGDFKIKPVKIQVIDLFHHLEEKYAAELKEKNIKFHFKGDRNTSLATDRLLLEYVVDKIFNNAVKYSFPGQDICLQEATEGDQIVLSVIDCGAGMAEKYVSAIFSFDNPIFQGTAGEKGVGLSLKIVKNFVSLMRGNIQITSIENKGTTVSLFLDKLIE
ncbi:HAMP domain-containing sensor histidine kinase [Chryseobacterium sp.]|uniref:sensor histidine kinase n=1 Tax=Chryseobacterium sp. TaxID=1871047 RepID=UPI0025BF7F3B|nr:HAMP domain-containing sensor histidine kinase [Chryseobacterium sp.]MBV8327816.1 HAMP domain-containing histidine kinase [Chryseobacterium sp.]